MNYLKNIVKFESSAELDSLSDKSYKLWHKMMFINNACSWKNWFSASVDRLRVEIGATSRTTVYNAINQLVQYDLLMVKPGKPGKSASYHLIPLIEEDRVKDIVIHSNVQSNVHVQSSVQGNGQGSVQDSVQGNGRGSVTLNNLIKSKCKSKNTSGKSMTSHKKVARKFAEDSTEMRLALYLFAKIQQNNPEHVDLTESQKQKWADHIRLMIERDKRTPQQIHNMIDWCQSNDFWKQNILSTAKLRKQYDTMRPKAKAEWERGQVASPGTSSVMDDPWFNKRKKA